MGLFRGLTVQHVHSKSPKVTLDFFDHMGLLSAELSAERDGGRGLRVGRWCLWTMLTEVMKAQNSQVIGQSRENRWSHGWSRARLPEP